MEMEPDNVLFMINGDEVLARFQLPGLQQRPELSKPEQLASYLELPLSTERLREIFPDIKDAKVNYPGDIVTLTMNIQRGYDTERFKEKIRPVLEQAVSVWLSTTQINNGR